VYICVIRGKKTRSKIDYFYSFFKLQMPITHKNCHGQVYYLHEGKTKTGKPKYFVSMKSEGNLAAAIPAGFEIYERPGGLVSVRKIPQTPILPHELKYVQDKVAPLGIKKDEKEYAEWCSEFGEAFILPSKRLYLSDHRRTRYEAEIRGKEIIIYEVKGYGRPMMKFVLDNEETREYSVYLWCFRGGIDGWFSLFSSGQLRDLVDQYCPALGTDRFYEYG
jgi:hypothetical protein